MLWNIIHYLFSLSELKEVRVDSRMKLLAFHTDHRPPYRGTYSKSSNILNGRRPYEKDFKIFNYDFDSEGEWEEGDAEGSYATVHFVDSL